MNGRKLHLEVQRALADHLLADRWAPALAHLVLLALVTPLAWGLIPRGALITWGGASAALTLARIVLWRWSRSGGQPPASGVLTSRITMTTLGLAWGIGTAAAAPRLPFTTVAVIVTGLAGLLA